MTGHAYTEDQLVEQPAIALFAEPGWSTLSAMEEVFGASGTLGRGGVYWQTQGSGKNFSMVFFAQKILRKVKGNWSFVVVTGRGFQGKAMVVAIDKATALKMHDKVNKRWNAELARVSKEFAG